MRLGEDDEHLLRWFRFTTPELNTIRKALICSPHVSKRAVAILDEIRHVIRIREESPSG